MIKKLTILLIILVFSGCGVSEDGNRLTQIENEQTSTQNGSDTDTNQEVEQQERVEQQDSTDSNNVVEEHKDDGEEDSTTTEPEDSTAIAIEKLMKNMSLEEKIAQLFIVDTYNMTETYEVKAITEGIINFMDNYPVSGVIHFSDNIETREQISDFNQALQQKANLPMFIAVDEEGGIVSRLGKADVGVDTLESAKTLARTYSTDEVKALAADLGSQIIELGFNYNFAPVFDANTNPNNPVIGNRAFGNDVETVSAYAVSFYQGLEASGVISSAKHFPGHGDTGTDSHLGIASIDHDLTRLMEVELVPFVKAIEEGVPTIMVGHITAPMVTGTNDPASLSAMMMTDILRDDLGFEGVIISDSFRMQAITDYYGQGDVGRLFIQAGGDIILLPENFEEAYNGLLDSVEQGVISEERINESVARILKVKIDYGLIDIELSNQ